MGDYPNRIRYTGQQYDQVTGQYYLRARFYNPVLGRFLQEDVYHGDGLNLYTYCRNNPVGYYDPSGFAGTNVEYPNGEIVNDGNPDGLPPKRGKGTNVGLTRHQTAMIDKLRQGETVSVNTVEEARKLLDAMPEVQPPPLGRMNPEFSDPKGSYRGDLINKEAPSSNTIHDPKKVRKHPEHAKYPHYNIYYKNGKKATILITGE